MKQMKKVCPITKTLNYLSKKWTLLILRELHDNGTKRFNDLIREMENISPRTLSKRLKELEILNWLFRCFVRYLPLIRC